MLHGLARVLGATEQDAAAAGGSHDSELIEGEALAAGLEDASTGVLGEPQGNDAELGDLKHTDIVSDGPDQDSGLVLLALHELGQLAQGKRRLVSLGHKQPLQDNLVEVAVGPALQEAVELHKELQVHIVGLGGSAPGVLGDAATGLDVDTHGESFVPLVMAVSIRTSGGEGDNKVAGTALKPRCRQHLCVPPPRLPFRRQCCHAVRKQRNSGVMYSCSYWCKLKPIACAHLCAHLYEKVHASSTYRYRTFVLVEIHLPFLRCTSVTFCISTVVATVPYEVYITEV